MISFCANSDSVYYPVFTNIFASTFSKLADSVMQFVETEKIITVKQISYFDFDDLDSSFECDFIELPDSVSNEDDFKKWIMEMKLE